MSELDTFRSESREWLEENCPHEMRDLSFHWEEAHEIYRLPKAKVWLERMAEKGWVAANLAISVWRWRSGIRQGTGSESGNETYQGGSTFIRYGANHDRSNPAGIRYRRTKTSAYSKHL